MKMASPAPSDSSSSTSSSSSAASDSKRELAISSAAGTKVQPPPSPSPVFAPRPVRVPQAYFRLQRPLVTVGDENSGVTTMWRYWSTTTPSPGLKDDAAAVRRRNGSVSSISSTSSALASMRLESVDEGTDDGSSEAGEADSPTMNRDVLEELRTITRLPPASIDRSSSPSQGGRYTDIVRSSRASPAVADTMNSLGSHRRLLSETSGNTSPADPWKRPFPSPVSRKIMRNPILFNKDFDQE